MAEPPAQQDSKIEIQCKGTLAFFENTEGIEQMEAGPFPVGTRIRVQSLTNDPMNLSGKLGTVAWLVPGGASVAIDGEPEKVKLQDACMMKELGAHAEILDESGEPLALTAEEANNRQFIPEKLNQPLRFKCTCKRNEAPDALKATFQRLLERYCELVVNAGFRNNPTVKVQVEAVEMDGQALATRDPFKWAEPGSPLEVKGTFTVSAPNKDYSTKPYQAQGSACCSLQ